MTKKIFLGIIMVAVAFASLATVTYAWWAAIINGPAAVTEDVTVEVGTAEDVNTSFSLEAILAQTGGELVPAGRAVDSIGNPVEEVTFNQEVLWSEDVANIDAQLVGSTVTGDLEITISDIEINTSITYSNLVNIFVSFDNTTWIELTNAEQAIYTLTLETAKTVYFKVTLTEPADYTAYQTIVGQDITFTVNYSMDDTTIAPQDPNA